MREGAHVTDMYMAQLTMPIAHRSRHWQRHSTRCSRATFVAVGFLSHATATALAMGGPLHGAVERWRTRRTTYAGHSSPSTVLECRDRSTKSCALDLADAAR